MIRSMTGYGRAEMAGSRLSLSVEFKSLNHQLQGAGKEPLTPETFSHALDRLAPVSFALHGRPPTMQEIAQLTDAHPKAVNDFYHSLPDQHYPHVPAGEMVKSVVAAKPWANPWPTS